jgi:O-antigen ligase
LSNGIPADGDFRKISVFMLHIRFSLLIVMAILILLYLTFYNRYKSIHRERLLFFISACLLIAFLFFLRSFTGIIIFVLTAMVFLINLGIRNKRPVVRYALLILISGFSLVLAGFFLNTYMKNFRAKPFNPDSLEKFTASGNPYTHNIASNVLENGNYIDLYVCEPELRHEWNKISGIPYDSTDMKGQAINTTIKRYVTSMGLRKDSAALSSLTTTHVRSIEKGLTNYKFTEDPGIYQRIYETLWEIQILAKTGYVQQHSLGQRFAFIKAADYVFSDHKWTGVGTGDVYDSMLAIPKTNIPEIEPRWEGKPHNQYVFFLLAFGIFGLLWIAWCWIFPVARTKTNRFLLFNLFAGIILISMLTLDTLESYDSMVFFTFFYCLFAFGTEFPKNKNT